MNVLIAAAWRPLAGILIAGLLRFLTDLQAGQKLTAALVDGGLVCAYAAAGVIGLPVVVTGIQGMVQKATAGQQGAPRA